MDATDKITSAVERMAIKQRWPISDEARRAIASNQILIASRVAREGEERPTRRESTAAARVLATLDGLNLQEEQGGQDGALFGEVAAGVAAIGSIQEILNALDSQPDFARRAQGVVFAGNTGDAGKLDSPAPRKAPRKPRKKKRP